MFAATLLDMVVRTAVVTGANRGIGLAVARGLAAHGLRVVLVSRSAAQVTEACDALRTAGADARVAVGDLGSVRTTRELTAKLLAEHPRIDVLVHNAGVWTSRLERNEDGLERAFAVNHVAPFVLNRLLEPRLVECGTRVVQVSAGLYVKGRPDLARTPAGDDFHPLRTYATTKLCNLLLMPLFADRWRGKGPTIDAVHPGVIRTGLGDRDGVLGLALGLVKRLWKAPAEGARPVVRLALDEALTAGTGRYFHVDEETPLLPVARDAALARALWEHASGLLER